MPILNWLTRDEDIRTAQHVPYRLLEEVPDLSAGDGGAGDRGLDLYCDAERLRDGLSPDPARVGMALREMRDLLAEADAPADRYAAALRWHGARLSDLAARLPA